MVFPLGVMEAEGYKAGLQTAIFDLLAKAWLQ